MAPLLLCAFMLAASVEDGESWALVGVPDAGARVRLAELAVRVHYDTPQWVLVSLADRAAARLAGAGLVSQRLMARRASADYFVADQNLPGAVELAPGLFLWPGTRAEALARRDQGVFIKPLPQRGFAVTPSRPVHVPAGTDSLVERLVAGIEQDSLRARIATLQSFGTRYSFRPGADSASVWLHHHLADLGLPVEVDSFANQASTCTNVIATLDGVVHPESVVIVCGHYDSYSSDFDHAPGADDDGSGVAGVLEAARVMSGRVFRNTVMFIAFSGEEQFMVGSYHFVQDARARGMKIISAVNLDMISYPATGDTTYQIVYTDTNSTPVADLAVALNTDYAIGLNLVKILDQNVIADHTPFWDNDYRAVLMIEDTEYNIWHGTNPNYHTPQDSLSTLHLPLGTRVARLGTALTATLAGPLVEVGVADAPRQPALGLAVAGFVHDQLRLELVLPGPSRVTATLYDATGRVVDRRPPTAQAAGRHELRFDTARRAAGVYFVAVEAAGGLLTGKVTKL